MKKQLLNLFLVAGFVSVAGIAKAQYSEPIEVLTVPATTGAIVMDGVAEASYSAAITSFKIAKRAGAATADYEDPDGTDTGAEFKVCWDRGYLYVYLEVKDDVLEPYLNGAANSWTWDNAEVFIDLDTNSTTATFSATSTTQIRFTPGLKTAAGADSVVESNSADATKIGDFLSWVDPQAAGGWALEVAIPWTAATNEATVDINAKIAANTVLGFDIAVADGDGDGTGAEGGRNVEGGSQMFWDLDNPIANEDNAYQDRRVFGHIILAGTPVEALKSFVYNDIEVYPNPANETIVISNYSGSAAIYSLTGSKVMEIDNVSGVINIGSLYSGVYILATEKGATRIIKN